MNFISSLGFEFTTFSLSSFSHFAPFYYLLCLLHPGTTIAILAASLIDVLVQPSWDLQAKGVLDIGLAFLHGL
jgi:hypothetical protein